MAKQKALSTQLKEANAKIEALEKKLVSEENSKKYVQERANKAELEIDSVHAALDAMMIPRTVKSGYSETTMTIASRLFAWQAGARLENVKREVE